MKKIIYSALILLFSSLSAFAQNEIDALRYSRFQVLGSSRSMAMGNAFGALGADLSVLSTNPAGIGVYRRSELSITPGFGMTSTEGFYSLDNSTLTDQKYNFHVNNLGFAGAFGGGDENSWNSVTFAFSYNKLKSFNRNYATEGINNSSSMLDHLMYNADGHHPDYLYDTPGYEREVLAWDRWMLDTIPDTDYLYWHPLLNTNYGQTQRKTGTERGSIGEYNFAFAANYANLVYIGASLAFQSVFYQHNSTYSEFDSPDDLIYDFKSFNLREHLKTNGTGVNFKLGVIIRPINLLRIGLAIHTPTFYSLQDEYETEFDSHFDVADADGYKDYPTGNDPYLPNILVSDYELTTPFKAIGSLGFVLGQYGIISAEYEYMDYSGMRMSSNMADFFETNQFMQDEFGVAHNIRFGAEFRVLPGISLRGGYALMASPYASSDARADASESIFSGGLGLSNKDFFFDLGVSFSEYDDSQYLYSLPVDVDQSVPRVDFNTNNILVSGTFGIRF